MTVMFKVTSNNVLWELLRIISMIILIIKRCRHLPLLHRNTDFFVVLKNLTYSIHNEAIFFRSFF